MTQRRSAVGVGWMAVGKTAHYFIGRGKALCRQPLMQSSRAVEPDDLGTGCCEVCWHESQAIDGDMIHAMKATGRYLAKPTVVKRGKPLVANKFIAKKYGLSAEQTSQLVTHPRFREIEKVVERFRESNGFPATNSPLARGVLLETIRKLN